MAVGFSVLLFITPYASEQMVFAWFLILLLVNIQRWYISYRYRNAIDRERQHVSWHRRFANGAYLSAVTWGLALWMCYPHGHPQYEVFLLLAVLGLSVGALVILGIDRRLVTNFNMIIMLFTEARLATSGSSLTFEMMVVSLMFFFFLIRGGRQIADSHSEMLMLRQQADQQNWVLLSNAEQIAQIGYWQWNSNSDELELSPNLMEMLGIDKVRISFEDYLEHVHEDDRARLQASVISVLQKDADRSVEYRMMNPSGKGWIVINQVAKSIFDDDQNQIMLGTIQNISQIKSAEKKLLDMAYFDELTGLANRGHFQQYLIEKIKQAARNNLNIAVLSLDLDGFKEINDTFGLEKGDEYLKSFGRHLKGLFREEDFIARLGGDEFCIVQSGIDKGVEAATGAERCLGLSNDPISIKGHLVSPKMSIGIALYPQDGKDVDSLLRAVDTALHTAKQKGGQCFEFYDSQMTIDAAVRLELDSDLKKALDNDEFKLLYQPKVSLLSGRMMGVEALIRWHHPQRGVVAPDEFISAAERNGLIVEIGEWVLEKACMQQRAWADRGYGLEMAVNISSSHFSSERFVEYVHALKNRIQLPDHMLEVEITESLSRDPTQHIAICRQLRDMSIKVAIDDFGTGYSSLSVLRQLEADTLKIDRAFIQYLPGDNTSALLVRAISTMAIGLGYDVVAEGVETEEQARFLREMGNPYVQGFLYSRPVEAEQIPPLIDHFNLLEEKRTQFDTEPKSGSRSADLG